ncbi:hypothetical protein HXY32_00310 [Candidatus Bathyarchaeota archaeon]|nr:hypothetical protein [Candidatus Bathyarchaeota archaeon]
MDLKLAEKIRNIPKKIKRNRINLLIVAIWSTMIAALVINEYLAFCYSDPLFLRFIEQGGIPPPFYNWQGATLKLLDILIISVASFISGILIVEVDKVFYGSISALIISSVISSVYIGNFIWNVGGWGQVFHDIVTGWSWTLYWGLLNTFRALFPIVFFFTIVCAFLGAFSKELIYSA